MLSGYLGQRTLRVAAVLCLVSSSVSQAQNVQADSAVARADSLQRARQASDNCAWANRVVRTLTPDGRVGNGVGSGAALSVNQVQGALSLLVSCGADGGATAGWVIRTLRTSADTALLERFIGGFANFRDAQVYAAALDIAGDRSASTEARVYAFRTLAVLRSGKFWLRYRSFLANDDAGGGGPLASCGSDVMMSHGTPHWHDGAPLPTSHQSEISALASRVFRDRTEPVYVRSASSCALGG